MQTFQSMALIRAMRPANTHGSVLAYALPSSVEDTVRARDVFPNLRRIRKKYKSSAKEKRKAEIREKRLNTKPDEGDIPPFFLPARYKLLFKVIEDSKNSTRIGRKPMPDDLKKKFAAHAKEYAEYKQA